MNKKIIIIFIIVIFIFLFDNIILNYYIMYDNLLIYNNIYEDYTELFKLYYSNTDVVQNQHKSEVLNCLYISRYMGQDWNKKFFYFDNYNNLTDYCRNLIDHVKEKLVNNYVDTDNIKNKNNYYYRYINDLVLYTRGCIDLTGTSDENYCNKMNSIIESQTDIKKNMCLFNVDSQLCNQIKIENNTPIMNGYLDKNMTMYGRDFYSSNRNYKIHNLPKLDIIYDTNNNSSNATLYIGVISIVSIICVYYTFLNK